MKTNQTHTDMEKLVAESLNEFVDDGKGRECPGCGKYCSHEELAGDVCRQCEDEGVYINEAGEVCGK